MRVSKVATHYSSIIGLRKGGKCKPRFVDLHTSNHCNQNCKGCAYRNKLDHKMMSEIDHFKVVEKLVRYGVKGFDFAGGGEPLTLSYLPAIWNYLKENGCYYGVITNGTLLTPSLMEQIINQATYIRISLEASDKESYCKYKRVKATNWDHVLSNISFLTRIKRETNSSCDVALKFSVGKSLRNLLHYRNGIGLGANLEVDNVQFKALRHEPEELSLKEKQLERTHLFIASQDCPPNFVREWIIPWQYDIPQCYLNPLHTVVDYKGDVYICCYYYYREEEHRIGNILTQNFEDFWMQKDHIEKIRNIDKNKCAKVDCKFFWHHKEVEELFTNGRCEFL
ncbi:MAG: radical SAM/SPASM domain-containing protein [Candidatus Heimdallarchaeaceae archaeon]